MGRNAIMILDSVQIVLTIFIIIGAGSLLTHFKWFSEDTGTLFSRLVVRICLPAKIIESLFSSFDRTSLLSVLPGLIVPFLSMGLSYLIAMLFVRLFRIPRNHAGTFKSMFSLSNSVFVGTPICLALFGNEALPYTLLYYIANTIIFWTIGVEGIRRDGGFRENILSFKFFKNLLSPPLLTFLICFISISIGLPLPKMAMDAAKHIGNMVTPLSLFFTGIIIYRMLKKGLKWEKGYLPMIFGRFIISPILVILFLGAFNLPTLMANTFIIQAAMPAMGQTPILAAAYNADEEFAAGGVALTTLMSLISIPVYMVLIS